MHRGARLPDPANLEGATATVEIDLASLASGSAKRDGHLKFPRADFNVGTEPGPEESVAKELEIQLQLTLTKT